MWGCITLHMQLWLNVIVVRPLLPFHAHRGAPVCTLVPSPALDVMAVGLSDGRAVLHNVRYDKPVVTFANAAGVGQGEAALMGGAEGRAAGGGGGGACTAISFRTGESMGGARLQKCENSVERRCVGGGAEGRAAGGGGGGACTAISFRTGGFERGCWIGVVWGKYGTRVCRSGAGFGGEEHRKTAAAEPALPSPSAMVSQWGGLCLQKCGGKSEEGVEGCAEGRAAGGGGGGACTAISFYTGEFGRRCRREKVLGKVWGHGVRKMWAGAGLVVSGSI